MRAFLLSCDVVTNCSKHGLVPSVNYGWCPICYNELTGLEPKAAVGGGMQIALIVDPSSTLVKGRDADLMKCAQILWQQLANQVCPAYERTAPQVQYFPDPNAVPSGWFQIAIFDQPDAPGAAGYHDEEGMPYGKVFVQPMLDAGSDLLSGSFPLSRTICHEGIELFGDARVNVWADKGDGTETPYELCDAVEDDPLMVALDDGNEYPGSNFVLPAWFDVKDQDGPYDYMGNVQAAFGMTPNGYQTLRNVDNNSINQVFGDKVPDWKKKLKQHPALRSKLFFVKGGVVHDSQDLTPVPTADPTPPIPDPSSDEPAL